METRPKKASGLPLMCEHCSADFYPVNANQIYCSKKCKNRAVDKRYRDLHRGEVTTYQKSYYEKNKERWASYREKSKAKREKSKAKREKSKARKEKYKEDQKRRDAEYNKRHPGLSAFNKELRSSAGDEKEGIHRDRRFSVSHGKTLLAASRILAAEMKHTRESPAGTPYFENAREILKAAALILLTRAGSDILTKGEKNGKRLQKTEGPPADAEQKEDRRGK